MIHHHQRVPLLLKPRDHPLCIHPEFADFQSHPPSHARFQGEVVPAFRVEQALPVFAVGEIERGVEKGQDRETTFSLVTRRDRHKTPRPCNFSTAAPL